MSNWKLEANFLFVKKNSIVSLVSTDPSDPFVYDLKGPASEMFLSMFEEKLSEAQTIQKILREYEGLTEAQVKQDLQSLLAYLQEQKIVSS